VIYHVFNAPALTKEHLGKNWKKNKNKRMKAKNKANKYWARAGGGGSRGQSSDATTEW